MSIAVPRPAEGEFAPFYAKYVALVQGDDPVAALERQGEEIERALGALDEERALGRYAPGKWSVKEVLGHVTDTERVFTYRLLRVARGDRTPLAGFEENAYVAAAGFDARPLAALLAEFLATRASTLALLRSLPAEAWERRGLANGQEVSARAIAYILPGHAAHHFRMLREEYGVD